MLHSDIIFQNLLSHCQSTLLDTQNDSVVLEHIVGQKQYQLEVPLIHILEIGILLEVVEDFVELVHALNIDFVESRYGHQTTNDLPPHGEEWRALAIIKHVVHEIVRVKP